MVRCYFKRHVAPLQGFTGKVYIRIFPANDEEKIFGNAYGMQAMEIAHHSSVCLL